MNETFVIERWVGKQGGWGNPLSRPSKRDR